MKGRTAQRRYLDTSARLEFARLQEQPKINHAALLQYGVDLLVPEARAEMVEHVRSVRMSAIREAALPIH